MPNDSLLEEGTVLAVEHLLATVRVERSSSCASCSVGCMCAGGENGNKIMMVQAVNRAGARIGDRVRIALEPEKLVTLSALAYLFPLIFLFLGAFLGPALAAWLGLKLAGDPARAVFSLVGLALGIGMLKLIFLRIKPSGRFTPVLIEVIQNRQFPPPILNLADRP